MKSINLNIKSIEVDVKTRALRSEWTVEMAKDLSSSEFDMSSFENYFVRELRRENRKKSINKIFQN